ncbi:hypothetical protein SGUI_2034 [Serinicoccus hydrothermalis]|uniref:ABM domain-containing protein n=1 Tax=Serinicoccus hydrothermalis TaxID=1758689 RepID=A0A1B1NDA0_9MICO|nr:antibiotic biosynthesis monooxygenase [Serinicoccus hydrothermalis]ANS79430.1 hypothetical protein SGUI_2034 [Serinicoccus hydrothermalis]
MSTSQQIRGTARITIHEGRLEEFRRLAARCVEIVRAEEPGTLEYAFYLDADGTHWLVHERYRDSAAGLEHMDNIGALMEELSQVCTMTGEVCGTPSPELRAALEAGGVTVYEPADSAW